MHTITPVDIYHILSNALNRVDMRLINHGRRVAYILYKMMETEGENSQRTLVEVSALAFLHDLGAYKTEEIDHLFRFETDSVLDHSLYGYLFLKTLSPLKSRAEAVLWHHLDYEKAPLPLSRNLRYAQMIKLADRVDILAQRYGADFDPLVLQEHSGTQFCPELYELFLKAEEQFGVMERLQDESYLEELEDFVSKIRISRRTTRSLLQTVAFSIDFRSEFTVVHTITTVSISLELARLVGLDKKEQGLVYYGALLHDLGKIGIPLEILEKPGALTDPEMDRMKTHVDITEEILMDSVDPSIRDIALRHHEKLDGSGYPRGLRDGDFTIPQQIVAIADMVSALQSRRSYKEPFPKEVICKILLEMRDGGKLSPTIIDLVLTHYDTIQENVDTNCREILAEYAQIQAEYQQFQSEHWELFL